ncbi:ABC transporter permease subunit [Sporomusa sphaeroides DSM 2875]|jgi:peptide/nickel transport system permease protein|uniref:nickel transporter permease n=1 Tax=Sporomusa sphaeroides TaxID=47679 RepID=UPI00202F6E56|nr:nickel transporter permease [Sporomusa sphaeroides]MCM0757457.1 ABC transporter permease subunit [Sporomusa sphaeroides DSM 2875]
MKQNLWSMYWQRLKQDKAGICGLLILLVFAGMALTAPYLSLHDPLAVQLGARLQNPSAQYPFGTDHLGRCIFSRVVYGAQVSLAAAGIVLASVLIISLPVGMFSGYTGGMADQIFMRIVDTILAFPLLILALAIAGFLGAGLVNVMLALAAVWWVSYARIVRGLTLAAKEKDFVMAARAAGTKTIPILYQHILPHVLGTVIVLATLDMGKLIMAVAGLSFLGLGAQPPTPEWGSMLNDGRPYFQAAPHVMLFPGLAIATVVLSCNLFGDALRDALNPQGMTE